jgi:transposase
MEEVADEPLYRERVCGIDIGKTQMAATIRVRSEKNPARRAQETRVFATTRRGVLALADWLRCWHVPAVAMEATGGLLEAGVLPLEAEEFECVLAGARQVKNLPGRPKRDPSDSRWLTVCFERGSVTPCFVATAEFRLIRLRTRYRRDLTEDRTRDKNRVEKLPESAAVKISAVLTGVHGGHRAGHHGPPDRRRARPEGARAAGPPTGPGQDPAAGRGPGRDGVLHPGARRPAAGHTGVHRPGRGGDRAAAGGDRTAAGPV